METCNMTVSLSPIGAGDMIAKGIVNGNLSGTLIDHYVRHSGDKQIVVVVLEKCFFRTSNRASMTVTIDNLEEKTVVHAVSSGSSQGAMFRFDWGAGGNFVESVRSILQPYLD